MALLEFQNVSFGSQDELILKDISFKVKSGDFISVVGPSGSGKITLLRLCSHLISPNSGEILLNGKCCQQYDPVEWRKNVHYCFQTPCLFGQSVMDNMEFPYTIRKMKPDLTRIQTLFSLFSMSPDYLKRDIKNLSGGEKQRIVLIRSMIFMPKILLLDEVTSALDVDNTQIVEKAIASLNQEGVTILWVTHNPEQSMKYANKLLSIDCGKIKSFEEVIK